MGCQGGVCTGSFGRGNQIKPNQTMGSDLTGQVQSRSCKYDSRLKWPSETRLASSGS